MVGKHIYLTCCDGRNCTYTIFVTAISNYGVTGNFNVGKTTKDLRRGMSGAFGWNDIASIQLRSDNKEEILTFEERRVLSNLLNRSK